MATPTAPRAAPDVTVVVTGHREGPVAEPTLTALGRALDEAAAAGVAVEVVAVLDRADEETAAVFARSLADDGTVGRRASARIVTTDHGDPGAARNQGVRVSTAPWVCMLDADNLPTRAWLVTAHRVASGHGAPCVVHPEHLVIFGERWQAWPQLSTDHPGFRVQNFYDRTYWDTFCLAAREVFDAVPYAPTSAASGLGPEDWHWGMQTVHAGIEHLVAPGTALLYRVKASASVQDGHVEARSLLPPSSLLVDPAVATYDEGPEVERARVLDPLQEAVLRPRPTAPPTSWTRRWRRQAPPDDAFAVAHYRALHADVLRLDDDAAARHYREVGQAEERRALLTEAELRDVRRLDLDDYRALHPDLGGLAPADLLHHYLAHGRGEGRAPAMTSEQRDALRAVVLPDPVLADLRALHELEPGIPQPSPEVLADLHHVGPPSDGSLTSGSRAWWDLVRRVGSRRPEEIVFVGTHDAASVPVDDAATLVVLTGVPGGSGSRPGAVRLHDLEHWERLTATERRRLMATLVVQYGPSVVRHVDSPEFADAAREYATALGSVTRVEGPPSG
jgi:glycosyltransferase involved in cell wall biosynthesis